MHHRDLEITHRAFYYIEPRASYYDDYISRKKQDEWKEFVTIDEVQKLFKFITSWDYHFEGDASTFQRIYSEIFPGIELLRDKSIDTIDLDNETNERTIIHMFDKVANLSKEKYQATDSSKILHTILPNLIVMWDREIRKGILGSPEKNWGTVYVWEFLPKMQQEAREVMSTLGKLNGCDDSQAKSDIEKKCSKTLAKLLDEHNYVVFTKKDEFKLWLQESAEKEITDEEYQRLLDKIP